MPDGSPGPNYAFALQNTAQDTDTYQNSPQAKAFLQTLPPPITGGPSDICKTNGV